MMALLCHHQCIVYGWDDDEPKERGSIMAPNASSDYLHDGSIFPFVPQNSGPPSTRISYLLLVGSKNVVCVSVCRIVVDQHAFQKSSSISTMRELLSPLQQCPESVPLPCALLLSLEHRCVPRSLMNCQSFSCYRHPFHLPPFSCALTKFPCVLSSLSVYAIFALCPCGPFRKETRKSEGGCCVGELVVITGESNFFR